ncbi:hypothetical protein CRG98_042250 [Punica granatum]|uniref:Uncharacterized protein n=1 Tax=Punica granatum TaxID=22663 RepID=A0A2I0I0K9_PUNGR|nr:hypothetical protein CRG98_042250 [Punica granatum]
MAGPVFRFPNALGITHNALASGNKIHPSIYSELHVRHYLLHTKIDQTLIEVPSLPIQSSNSPSHVKISAIQSVVRDPKLKSWLFSSEKLKSWLLLMALCCVVLLQCCPIVRNVAGWFAAGTRAKIVRNVAAGTRAKIVRLEDG